MVKILLGPKRGKLEGDFPKDEIDDALSAHVKGYQFSPQFRRRRSDGSRAWDGRIHLYSRVTDSFPLGVVDIVSDVLQSSGIPFSITNGYTESLEIPEELKEKWGTDNWEIPDKAGHYTLYDYQKEAIKAFFDSSRILPYRGVIKLPTGGGKTATACAITKILNVPTLFMVHGKKLVRQNMEVFLKVFEGEEEKIGVIDANSWTPGLITIASSDTLYARLKNLDYEEKFKDFIENIVFVIADECHRSTSKSFAEVLKAINAPIRLGLSGTPNKKEDDRDLMLHSLTGPIMYQLDVPRLKDAGTISRAHLLSVIVSKPEIEGLEWQEAYDTLIINNKQRHELVATIVADRVKQGKTILLLAGNSIDLAQNLYDHIVKKVSKTKVKLVNGISKDTVVDKAFADLQKKKISCVITTTIADEGIDIPEVNCLLLAGGGKSFVRTVQRVGRSLRIKADGGHAEIIDILDVTNKYLKKHSLLRIDHYESESLFDSSSYIKAEELLEKK